MALRGDTKTQEEKNTHTHTRTLSRTTAFVFLANMFRFGTGVSFVTWVGIVDGSRAKYDVGI